ncbi:substrate-binding domain-containing protein [Acerihabitans arboris]|uniref:LysR substrate-binding domain-containing protein n=1 Tax=Acerihabitans arboris TaxID=2691583 RepID=A0A845ST05_9GAMM|nr:substrate-binding domain-containing protein [Acerihabitans arboris]NDL65858.1 hypothetical protein [Acerihabitans arboris]
MSLLREAQQLGHSISASQELSGELVIGATVSLAPTVIPELLARLANAHSRLRVRVVVRGANELLSMLELGGLELLVSYAISTPLLRLKSETLFHSQFGVIAYQDCFAVDRRTLSPSTLVGLPCAILDNFVSRQRLFDYLSSVEGGVDIDVHYPVGTLALCIELVRRKLAVAIIPLFPPLIRNLPPEVRWFELEPTPFPLSATVSWLAKISLSPSAQALLDEVAKLGQVTKWAALP